MIGLEERLNISVDLWEGQDFRNLLMMLDEYREKAEELYKQKLKADNRVVTGKLIDSVHTDVRINGLVYSVVFSAEDYYYWLEYGRSEGKYPPRDAILKWIQTKPILPRPMENGKLPTQEQLAFLIGRAIKENGTIKDKGYKGGDYLATTVHELNQIYLPKLQQALLEDWNVYSGKILNYIKTIEV